MKSRIFVVNFVWVFFLTCSCGLWGGSEVGFSEGDLNNIFPRIDIINKPDANIFDDEEDDIIEDENMIIDLGQASSSESKSHLIVKERLGSDELQLEEEK